MASVAIFGPQSKPPQEQDLNELRIFLTKNDTFQSFVQSILELKKAWSIFADHNSAIRGLKQGPRYLEDISEWLVKGKSADIVKPMSGILSLPLLVISHIGQYFQYLHQQHLTHSDFLRAVRKGGGIQGYCGGLPSALAIASSRTEEEVLENAAAAMRIALGIGAYAELGDDESVPGATTLVIRLKQVGQGEELVSKFNGVYISAITDPKTISVVGPPAELAKLITYARAQRLLVQEMHIRGKVHNPENKDLAKELRDLCDSTQWLRMPGADALQVPVRSNITGQVISKGSLVHEIVDTILASRCEWYTLMTELAQDLDATGNKSHIFALFGLGDCVPLSPFHKLQLRISKVEVVKLVTEAANRDRMRSEEYKFPEDAIAVIGASVRLPGARSLDELWELVASGLSQHVEVPKERFDIHGSFRASQDLKFAGKRKFYGNFLDGADKFDHAFFRTNPKEALNEDPQQRLLLELAYEAMDSSGYLRRHRRESGDPVGCFIGASFVEYLENTNAHPPTAYTSTGTIRAFLCGKLSYYFGWSGPAEVIDTACSSSLVAINRACKAIQAGECPMALAGGISVLTGINNYLDLAKAGFLSPTGQCKPFDGEADGYCRADGAGLVVLKLLKDAINDEDQILGVIPAIATNQGGLSPSITIPHSEAQEKLYRDVLRKANMQPDQVSYVEAHGTGTQAGDPREVASIRQVFGSADRHTILSIGSLKGNIGHAETAAGVASLLKVLAMIRNRQIPPLASFKSLNPKIGPLETDRMAIATQVMKWDASILVACVNSYGAAGSNAALLCSAGPQNQAERSATEERDFMREYPVLISAASLETLKKNGEALKLHLRKTTPTPVLGDLVFTLTEKRKRHQHCLAFKTSSVDSLTESLATELGDAFQLPSTPMPLVLVFAGQSKQTIGMDQDLYHQYPCLKQYVNACNDIAVRLGFPAFLPVMFQTEPVGDVVALQCGTFAMQYAFAKSWLDAGAKVAAVIGHSFGELTAMVVAGILSLDDGLKLIAHRASLMQSKWGVERGIMIAVHSSRKVVESIIDKVNAEAIEEVAVACYNAPSSQVLVGSAASICRVENLLQTDAANAGIKSQRLDVTHGFHSVFTTPLLADLQEVSNTLMFTSPELVLEPCTESPLAQFDSTRPTRHAREPVYFLEAVRRIEDRLGACVWLEAGMNSPIIPMVKRAISRQEGHVFHALGSRDSRASSSQLAEVTISLWRNGLDVTPWDFLPAIAHGHEQIWLPPYQFQSTSHWLPNVDRAMEIKQQGIPQIEPLEDVRRPAPSRKLVAPQSNVAEDGSFASFTIDGGAERFHKIVSGHAVREQPLCPASMYMECAAMAVQILRGDIPPGGLRFEDLTFQAPLGVSTDREMHLDLKAVDAATSWTFTLWSTSKLDQKHKQLVHGKGKVELAEKSKLSMYERLVTDSMENLVKLDDAEILMSKRAYGLFSRVVRYADFLEAISKISLSGSQAVAEINIPEVKIGLEESTVTHLLDTIAVDTFIQVAGLLINSSDMVTKTEVFVAAGIDNVVMSENCNMHKTRWTVYTKYSRIGEGQAAADVFVLTPAKAIAMTISGVHFSRLPISKLEKLLASANRDTANQDTALLSRGDYIKPAASTTSLQTTSDETSLPELDETSSVTSISDSGLVTPVDDVAKSLRDIITSYTGLDQLEMNESEVLGDLGIDSLAATELSEELQSKFDKEIAGEELLTIDFGALLKLFAPDPKVKTKVKSSKAPKRDSSEILQSAASTVQDALGKSSRRQEVLQLLSECSGAPASSIKTKSTIAELGVDSLAAVELKSEIESVFSLEIDDEDLTLDSTVEELLSYLGIQEVDRVTIPSGAKNTVAGNLDSLVASSMRVGTNDEKPKLSDPFQALSVLESSFDQAAEKRGFSNYWTMVAPKQNELLLAYISEGFRKLHVDLASVTSGQELCLPEFLPKHSKVMQRLIDILERHGILDRKGSMIIRGGSSLSQCSSSSLHESFVQQFPAYAGEANLMRLTGSRLADCLVGKSDAVTLMFKAPAAQEIMRQYYCDSPMLSTMTEQMVKYILKVIKNEADSNAAAVRILEVGAGFGGTTTRLAQAIEASQVCASYTFTDIAPSLVKNAKTKFASYPWMRYQTFNLEHDVSESMKGQYDIIVGTNCVHATKNKTRSLRRLSQLLRQDGIVVLSEVTELVDWYDIVFGLLDGWWLAEEDTYPLQPPESWMHSFEEAGYQSADYSRGSKPESRSQRLLVGSNKKVKAPGVKRLQGTRKSDFTLHTVVYKEEHGVKIEADIYVPTEAVEEAMPIALMVHGGGHMTLSRKAVRPYQTTLLIEYGMLPISLDYRLCPEVNLIEGPMADVRDALRWARTKLTILKPVHDLNIDTSRIVMIGWSSGGHLAMSTAWTAPAAGLEPPLAMLSFYAPVDFESGELDIQRAEEYPGRVLPLTSIARALSQTPITNYSMKSDSTGLGWVQPGDPRSELVLALFKEGLGLPLLLNGLSSLQDGSPSQHRYPTSERTAEISPLAQLRLGKYNTPTFLIHSTGDEIAPFSGAAKFAEVMAEMGLEGGLLKVTGKKHIHDLKLKPGTPAWNEEVQPGYDFLWKMLEMAPQKA